MVMSDTGVVFLTGKKVILRPPDKGRDLALCVKYINDPEVRLGLCAFMPRNINAVEAGYFDLPKDSTEIVLAIEVADGSAQDGEFIGMIRIADINYRDGTAITTTWIGDIRFRGRGFGTDAKMVLLDYCFNTLGIRKMLMNVLDFNKRSLRCGLRCGYKREGIRRKHHFIDGKYRDLIILACFRESWLPIWKRWKRLSS